MESLSPTVKYKIINKHVLDNVDFDSSINFSYKINTDCGFK